MATKIKAKPASNEMLHWQYKQILAQLLLLQDHAADPKCPCLLADIGEWCVPKHLLQISALAAETIAMDPANDQLLTDLHAEADDMHETSTGVIKKTHVVPLDLITWARAWRKRIEPVYFKPEKKAGMHQEMPGHNIDTFLGPQPLSGRRETRREPEVAHSAKGAGDLVEHECPGSTNHDRETGFAICECGGGELVEGAHATGDHTHVKIPLECPSGCQAVGTYHTHPGGTTEPSDKDVSEMERLGLHHMCIGVPERHEVQCYLIQ